jgi:hypothetical protein
MFARISEVSGSPDQIDTGVTQFRDVVLPALQQMGGFQRAYMLVDRASGKAVSVTAWNSRDSMDASEEAAGRLRDEVTENVGGQTTVSRYEVAVAEPMG